MEELREILQIVFSWPAAAIICLFLLGGPISKLINRLVVTETGKVKVGPIEVELGNLAEQGREAVDRLNRINYLMAESRLLELEITEGNFGPVFSDEQRDKMKGHIDELKKLTRDAR